MMTQHLRLVAFVLALGASSAIPSRVQAGCKGDCEDDYASAKTDCVLVYDDSDEADDLQICIDGAHSDYEDCEDECNS